MKKTKAIFASLVLAVSVAAVALTAWANKPMDPFFKANLEALSDTEDSLTFICNPNSPIVKCMRVCLNCRRVWETPGNAGQYIGSLDNCVCGSELP